jgi:hypothetical protein
VDVIEAGGVRMKRQRERLGGRGVVAKVGVLGEALYGIDPEAIGAAIAPEPHDVAHGLAHLRICPVQVGLFGIEAVEIPPAAALIAGPGGPAEGADPVVGRGIVGPHVPVRVLAEPGVLDRRVAGHEVEQHAQAAGVCGGDQLVDVRERPEAGVDAGEVGDVIAAVGAGRGVEGREPEGVDAEPAEVVEPGGDAADVAHAVAV